MQLQVHTWTRTLLISDELIDMLLPRFHLNGLKLLIKKDVFFSSSKVQEEMDLLTAKQKRRSEEYISNKEKRLKKETEKSKQKRISTFLKN